MGQFGCGQPSLRTRRFGDKVSIGTNSDDILIAFPKDKEPDGSNLAQPFPFLLSLLLSSMIISVYFLQISLYTDHSKIKK